MRRLDTVLRNQLRLWHLPAPILPGERQLGGVPEGRRGQQQLACQRVQLLALPGKELQAGRWTSSSKGRVRGLWERKWAMEMLLCQNKKRSGAPTSLAGQPAMAPGSQ